ncbi:TetR/AcrR family transcriptional regulator [Pendulispora albinea]|uniref:TetR/AcrR family transcriptional regulator n=1 Tax=Pendulispora albinea TaxID=2741071 RepID=A0ABZ2M7S1_9BACT
MSTSNRGRPRTFDREHALHRAMEVFWAKGYEGAQLTDLTAAMGINPPSFYAAFGSKEEAFREAVELYRGTVGASTLRALDAGGSVRDAVEGMLLQSVDNVLAAPGRGGCLLILGVVNVLPENEPLRRLLIGIRAETAARLQERLDRAVQEGELAQGTDTRALTMHFATVMQGLSLQARDGITREDLVRAVSSAVRVLDLHRGPRGADRARSKRR